LAPSRVSPANVSPAFSLADRTLTTRILTESGFDSIEFADVHAPVFYGPDADAAHDAIVGLFLATDRLVDPDSATIDVLQRVRALVNAHLSAGGVLFDSRAWIVTARKNR
jgi:hypothetical protein